MEIKKAFCYSFILGYFIPVISQSSVDVDTFLNSASLTHTYLDIKIPEGSMYLRTSHECGTMLSSLVSPDSFSDLVYDEVDDGEGNIRRIIQLERKDEMQPKSLAPLLGNNIAGNVSNTSTPTEPAKSISEFKVDPNTSTDLFIELGIGASHMDLSGLSIRNLIVHSALADVRINYSSQNQLQMEKMDVRAVRGDIGLKNVELARAGIINLQNDMGETKITLGHEYEQSTQTSIIVKAGVGNCTFIIHEKHPVKIHLRSGFFSTADISNSFLKINKGVYVNKAYQEEPQSGTVIICNTDFGNVSVIDHE